LCAKIDTLNSIINPIFFIIFLHTVPLTNAIKPQKTMPENQLINEYGPEPINYYGGSFLNRLSFLREDYKFLHKAFNHPSTQFLILDNLTPPVAALPEQPLVQDGVKKRDPKHALKFLTFEGTPELAQFLGSPYELDEAAQVAAWSAKTGALKPLLVFLGIDESAKSESDVLEYKKEHDNVTDGYRGRAYFAVDLTVANLKSPELAARAGSILKTSKELEGAEFLNLLFAVRLSHQESGVLAQAKMYIDWNNRNRFCGGCGKPTMSINGGTKLTCPPTDCGNEQPPCPTRGRISNLSFPRTDTSIIAIVVSYDGKELLLGRNKRFPKGFYSCLAGFLEPAETIEDCVRREIWEESGVTVGRVVVHSTQPWPYPANIMIGCVAQVASAAPEHHRIHLGHDPELDDARWYKIDDLRRDGVLDYAYNSAGLHERPAELPDDLPQLPPPEAVAFNLIDSIVSGHIRGF
jgi:NAD+ diphosphatase